MYRENSFRAQPQAGGRFYCLSSLTLQKLLNLSGLYIFLICELIKKTYKLQRIIVDFNEIAADASLIFITLMQMLTVASVLVLNLCDTELAASRFDRIMHPDFLLAGIHFSPQFSFLFIYTTSRVSRVGVRFHISHLFCKFRFEEVFIWGKVSKPLLWYQSAVKAQD